MTLAPTMLCRFIVHTSQTAAEGQHDIAFLLGDAAFAELHAATSTMCSDRQRQVCATCSSVARTQLRLHSKHTAAPGVPSTITEVAVEVRHCYSTGAQQSGDTLLFDSPPQAWLATIQAADSEEGQLALRSQLREWLVRRAGLAPRQWPPPSPALEALAVAELMTMLASAPHLLASGRLWYVGSLVGACALAQRDNAQLLRASQGATAIAASRSCFHVCKLGARVHLDCRAGRGCNWQIGGIL